MWHCIYLVCLMEKHNKRGWRIFGWRSFGWIFCFLFLSHDMNYTMKRWMAQFCWVERLVTGRNGSETVDTDANLIQHRCENIDKCKKKYSKNYLSFLNFLLHFENWDTNLSCYAIHIKKSQFQKRIFFTHEMWHIRHKYHKCNTIFVI